MFLELWHQTDLHTRRAGKRWYADARRDIRRLASEYSVPYVRACAVVAVLSPRTTWRENLAQAERVFQGKRATVLGKNADKAARVMRGEDIDACVSGPKVRAFYQAFLGDDHAVVLDSWMFRAFGHRTRGGNSDKATDLQYRRIAESLRVTARTLHIAPAHLQATIWIHVRGSHS